jgi:hypothetical protein
MNLLCQHLKLADQMLTREAGEQLRQGDGISPNAGLNALAKATG